MPNCSQYSIRLVRTIHGETVLKWQCNMRTSEWSLKISAPLIPTPSTWPLSPQNLKQWWWAFSWPKKPAQLGLPLWCRFLKCNVMQSTKTQKDSHLLKQRKMQPSLPTRRNPHPSTRWLGQLSAYPRPWLSTWVVVLFGTGRTTQQTFDYCVGLPSAPSAIRLYSKHRHCATNSSPATTRYSQP